MSAQKIGTAGAEVAPSASSIVSALEQTKRQWELAADALPQLVCLLDQNGKVIRANRTLERWGLAPVTQVRGLTVHELLHGAQCAADCEMLAFWRDVQARSLDAKELREERWDAKLDPAKHGLRTDLLKIPLLPYQLDGIAFAAGDIRDGPHHNDR